MSSFIRHVPHFSAMLLKSQKRFIPACATFAELFFIKTLKVRSKYSTFQRCTAFGIMTFAVNAASSLPKEANLTSREIIQIIKEADSLFDEDQFEKLVELLRPYKESGNVELIWRLSRAAYKLSKSPSLKKDEHAALVNESFSMAKLALELDDKSPFAHKWMSVALDAHSALQGFRARCLTLVPVKDHMIKSLEFDPTDASVIYMLGMWYYGIADLAWYQRKVLEAIGGQPPTATYKEALACFKKAEDISPNFYSLNLLMLGKCHLQLGDKDTAAVYLQQAASYPKHTEDDHQAHKEAAELLAKINKT